MAQASESLGDVVFICKGHVIRGPEDDWSLELADGTVVQATDVVLIEEPTADEDLDEWMRERGSC